MTDRVIPLKDFLFALKATSEYNLLSEEDRRAVDHELNSCFINNYSVHDSFYLSVKHFVEQANTRRLALKSFNPFLLECCEAFIVATFSDLGNNFRKKIKDWLLHVVSPITGPYLIQLGSSGISRISSAEFSRQSPFHYHQCLHIISCILLNTRICLNRLYEDYERHSAFFATYQFPVIDIDYLDADPHNGYQTVVCLVFSNNQRLVYKPRPLDGEVYLNEVLTAIHQENAVPAITEILPGEGYGWMKWVEAPRALPGKEIAIQLGALLVVSCTVALADLHCENVVLGSQGITVIDAEAINILYPDIKHQKWGVYPSVIDLGILPSPEGNNVSEWWDTSVLGATPGRETLPAGFVYDESTCRLKINYHTISEHHGAIKRCLADYPREEVLSGILKGFDQTWTKLSGIKPVATKGDNFRYIHRPTSVYSRTLIRLTDARFGSDYNLLAKELAIYLKDWGQEPYQKVFFNFARIIGKEIASLVHGDVPRFTKADLQQAAGTSIELPGTVWQLPDATFSKNTIALSFNLLQGGSSPDYTLERPERCQEATPALQLRKIALIVASHLVISAEGIPYGIHSDRNSDIPSLSRLNSSLYNGVSGLLLPLGYAISAGWEEYESIFNALVEFLDEELLTETENKKLASLSQGALGTIGVLSHLIQINPNKSLWGSQLNKYIERIHLVAWPLDSYDVVSGIAGCLLILNGIPSSFRNSAVKKIQEQLTAVLLDKQTNQGSWHSLGKRGLCGFSHGAAGIRYALGRILAQGTGPENKVIKAMHKAVAFEKSVFNAEKNNWKDLRYHGNSRMRDGNFSAWCHGAAGIGLAEAGLKRKGLPYFQERIEPAFADANLQFLGRQSICCGMAAFWELSRLLPGNDTFAIASNPPFHHEEINAPLSLFKSYWGLDFISAVGSFKADTPCFLLFE